MKAPILLSVPKVCSCGEAHYLIPENAKESAEPYFEGYYWNCSCKSTLFLPRNRVAGFEVCECSDCSNSGDPIDRCSFDCELDEECLGCRLSRLEREEDEWHARNASMGI